MNTTEDRLLAAIRETAAEIIPGSTRPLSLPAPARRGTRPRAGAQRRPGGRRDGTSWRRLVAPLAAAVSVVAVVIASLAISGGPHGQPPGSPARHHGGPFAGLPRYNVALANARPGPPLGQKQRAILRATATGTVLATIAPPKPYATFTLVTAASDDRTFVLGAGRWVVRRLPGNGREVLTTPTKFFLLHLGAHGRPAALAALPIPALSQQLAGIALSPDGSKLAVAFNHRSGVHVVDPEIEVFALGSGTARTWEWPGRAWITSNDAIDQQLLSWTADGRTIAFEQWLGDDEQVRLLDVAAPGNSLLSSTLILDFRHQAYTDLKFVHGKVVNALNGFNALITPDGTKIVCGTLTETRHPVTSEVAFTEFSARTGAVIRALNPMSFKGYPGEAQEVLWTSASGRTLIVRTHRPIARLRSSTVIGIVTGKNFVPLPGASADITDVVW